MVFYQGIIAFFDGDWQRAHDLYALALATTRAGGVSWASAHILMGIGEIAILRGHYAQGLHQVAEGVKQSEAMGDLLSVRFGSWLRAEYELLYGQVDQAVLLMESLLDRGEIAEIAVTQMLPMLAWAYSEQGQWEAATMLINTALARAREQRLPQALIDGLRIQASLALRRMDGDMDLAQTALTEALALSQQMAWPYYTAKVHFTLGQMYRQQQDHRHAVQHWQAAALLLQRLGEGFYAPLVQQALDEIKATAHVNNQENGDITVDA